VLLAGDEAGQVLRLLARLPQSADRDRYLRRLVGYVGEEPVANATPLRGNEPILRTIEDAATQGLALRFDYYSASRGHRRMRTASVHRLKGGDHWRFVATCHDRNRLCWFRVDNVLSACLTPEEPFRAPLADDLAAFVSTSLDGFSGDVSPVEAWFVVRFPEARWVRTNLPEEERFETTELGDGLRFQCKTTAIDVVARFLVGLGSAVTAASPELAVKTTTIARATLDALATKEQRDGSR
jgi:predicted DNA-binding transcriptional regulator YafY